MPEFKKDESEVGALWSKQGAKGEYLTGTIDGKPVVCFQNKSDNPKAPQWRVLKAKPKANTSTPSEADDWRAPHNANAPMPSDDDIQF